MIRSLAVAVLTGLAFVAAIALLTRAMLAVATPGVTVTSWWRTPGKQAELRRRGYHPVRGSAHLLAWAMDVVPPTRANEASLRRWFPFVLNEDDHLHVGWF
jgi:hypothetical protein